MYMPPVNQPCNHHGSDSIDPGFIPRPKSPPARSRCGDGWEGPATIPPYGPFIEPPPPSEASRLIDDVGVLQSFQSDRSMSDLSARRAIRVGARVLLESPLVANSEELRHLSEVLVGLGNDPGVSDASYRNVARVALRAIEAELRNSVMLTAV